MSKHLAVIFAGGTGSRMGLSALPKQFITVNDKPILIWTLEYFEQHPLIDEIYLACIEEWIGYTTNLLAEYRIKKVTAIVPGGKTAQHSIYHALIEARNNNPADAIVLIHDGVRPFISARLITNLIETVKTKGNAITCTPCHETIIICGEENKISDIPIRRHTFAAQAPQAFYLGDVLNAHDEIRKINPDYEDIVDACTLYGLLKREVAMVPGNIGNIKITRPEDVYILKGLLRYRESEEIILGHSLLDV